MIPSPLSDSVARAKPEVPTGVRVPSNISSSLIYNFCRFNAEVNV